MRRMLTPLAVAAVALILTAPAGGGAVAAQLSSPVPGVSVELALRDAAGDPVGAAVLTEVAAGVQVEVALENMPPGEHGIHVHAVGICEPSGEMPFAAAGPHFNPTGAPHGAPPAAAELATPFAAGSDQVAHAGDLGNITIGADGTGTLIVTTNRFTLSHGPTSLGGAYGASLVVHARADDLTSQPAGDSGDRIACGVIVASAAGTPVPIATPQASPVAVAITHRAFA